MSYDQPPQHPVQQPNAYGGYGGYPAPPRPQPGPGPYGEPQPGPYAPQPQPGYGYGYGGYPPPPPPAVGSRGKTIGIIVGAIAALAAGGVALIVALGGSDGGGPPAKLTTPASLLGGEYELKADTAALRARGLDAQKSMPRGVTSVTASYAHKGDPLAGLVISGGYGSELGNSAKVKRGMFSGLESSSSFTVAKPRQDYTVGGQTISCEVLKATAGSVYVPACAWADGSTAAIVLAMDQRNTTAEQADAEAFAKTTAQIRDQIRVSA